MCANGRTLQHKTRGMIESFWVDAGLITIGSLASVLSGKSHALCMSLMKYTVEAVDRIILREFLNRRGLASFTEGLPLETRRAASNAVTDLSAETIATLRLDSGFGERLKEYNDFIKGAQTLEEPSLGKTALLWLNCTDDMKMVLGAYTCSKQGSFPGVSEGWNHLSSLYFKYNSSLYGPGTALQHVVLSNIEATHPGASDWLSRSALVIRSAIGFNASMVDKTSEETMQRDGKSNGGFGSSGKGWNGMGSDTDAMNRWVASLPWRASNQSMLLEEIGMRGKKGRHPDTLRPSKTRSERAVTSLIKAIDDKGGFITTPDSKKFWNIVTSTEIPLYIASDMLASQQRGKELREEYVNERLKVDANGKTKVPFKARRKRVKGHCPADAFKKCKVVTGIAKSKAKVQSVSDALTALLLANSQATVPVPVKEWCQYQLTPFPVQMADGAGNFAKGNKAGTLNFIMEEYGTGHILPLDTPINRNKGVTMLIVDGNVAIQKLSYDYAPPGDNTYGGLISALLHPWLEKGVEFAFTFDRYLEDSTKCMERAARQNSDAQADATRAPVAPKLATHRPKTQSAFRDTLRHAEAKERLIKLVKEGLVSQKIAALLSDRSVYTTVEEKCFKVTKVGASGAATVVPELTRNQEESDTYMIVLMLHFAAQGYKEIRLTTVDSDVFFILMLHLHRVPAGVRVLLDYGSGDWRKLIDMTALHVRLPARTWVLLVVSQSLLGVDANGGFNWVGHTKGAKIVVDMAGAGFTEAETASLAKLGDRYTISNATAAVVEKFLCKCYRKTTPVVNVNVLREDMLRSKCKYDPKKKCFPKCDHSRIIPPVCNVIQGMRRANHNVRTWKQAHTATFKPEDPAERSGWQRVGGMLHPLWCSGPTVPMAMTDAGIAIEAADGEDEFESEAGSTDDEEADDGPDPDSDSDDECDDDDPNSVLIVPDGTF